MRAPAIWMRELGNTPDGLFVVDSRQRIVFWNQGAEKLLGYTSAEVLGRQCHEVVPGKTRAGKVWCHADCAVRQAVRRGENHRDFDLLVRAKDGRDRCTNVSIMVLSQRKRPLAVHLMRDTARQERDKAAMEEISGVLRTAGYPGVISSKTGQQGDPSAAPPGSLSRLTRREVEVLCLLAKGLSAKAISQRLGVSPYTVRNHIQNALDKLGLHNKAQAVSYAYKNGLV